MLVIRTGHKLTHDTSDIVLGQFVVVGYLFALLRSINEQCTVVHLIAFQNHNAGCNGGSEEQIARQLDDAVDKVVIDQLLPDLLLSTTTVHNAGEANDCSSSISSQPR